MNKIKSILFVCTGNSCRSVMAEGLLKKRLKETARADIKVSSAGLMALNDMPPTEETVRVMEKELMDVSGHKTRAVTDDDIKGSDLILVMEDFQKHELADRVPDSARKIYLLKEFGNPGQKHYHEGHDVPDPIGQPAKGYEYCFDMIKKEIDRIIKLL